MVRPRSTSSSKRTSAQHENLSALSSEVLKLRLQALNLPITGSRGQLLARLKKALPGNTSKTSLRTQKKTSLGTKAVQTRHRRANQAADRRPPAICPNGKPCIIACRAARSRTRGQRPLGRSFVVLNRRNVRKGRTRATCLPVADDTEFSTACRHRGDSCGVDQQRFGRLASAGKRSCFASSRSAPTYPRNGLPSGSFKASGT